MWFKNLQVFRFTKPFELEAGQLSEQLAERAFMPCGSQDMLRYGWVPPLGQVGSDYVHVVGQFIMICAKRQEKVLPASVINEHLAEQVLKISSEEGRAVGRKEKQRLKDDIVMSLLPRAFARSSQQFAYIAPKEGLIVVNSASNNRAQELLNYLRDTIGSLPVIPLAAKNTPQQVMTSWLEKGCAAKGFELGHECELRDPTEEGGVIRCKHQNLTASEIISHIKSGMYVSKLGLRWEDRIEFIVDSELATKRLVFEDIIQEKANQLEAQDAIEQFDIDFSIMTLELSAFISALTKAFGGEKISTADAEVASI